MRPINLSPFGRTKPHAAGAPPAPDVQRESPPVETPPAKPEPTDPDEPYLVADVPRVDDTRDNSPRGGWLRASVCGKCGARFRTLQECIDHQDAVHGG